VALVGSVLPLLAPGITPAAAEAGSCEQSAPGTVSAFDISQDLLTRDDVIPRSRLEDGSLPPGVDFRAKPSDGDQVSTWDGVANNPHLGDVVQGSALILGNDDLGSNGFQDVVTTYELVGDPAHGEAWLSDTGDPGDEHLRISDNGWLVYQTSGYLGADSVDYRLHRTDGFDDCSNASTIQIGAIASSILVPDAFTVQKDQTFTSADSDFFCQYMSGGCDNLMGNDLNYANGREIYRILGCDYAGNGCEVSPPSNGSSDGTVRTHHGRVTVFPDGRWSYTPDAGYEGADNFAYTTLNRPLSGSQGTDSVKPRIGIGDEELTVPAAGVHQAWVSVDLTVGDFPPPESLPFKANTDAFVTDEDTTLTITEAQLIANDLPVGDLNVDSVAGVFPEGYEDVVIDVAHGNLRIHMAPCTHPMPSGSCLSQPGITGVSFDPDPDFVGTQAFNYWLGGVGVTGIPGDRIGQVLITVEEVNDAPVAHDDPVTVDDQSATVIDVLGNDTDLEGNIDPATVALDTDVCTASLCPYPGVQLFHPRADGTILFDPAGTIMSGTALYPYTVRDTDGALGRATVVATIRTNPTRDDAYRVTEDTPLDVAAPGVLTNDRAPATGAVTPQIVTEPQHGDAVLDPDGALHYVPDPGFGGPDSLVYTRDGDTAEVRFVVQPVPDAPVVMLESCTPSPLTPCSNEARRAIGEGGPITLNGLVADQDVGDSGLLTIAWGDGGVTTLQYPCTDCGISPEPTWSCVFCLRPSPANYFSVQHTYGDDPREPSDTYTITVTARDRTMLATTETATATVTNSPPELMQSIYERATTRIDEGGEVLLPVDLSDNILDSHTVTADWGDGSPRTVLQRAALGCPINRCATPLLFRHRYTDDGAAGTPSDEYTVTITAVDDDGGIGTMTWKVTVDDVAPSVQLTAPPIDEGGEATLQGTITDPGTDSLTFDVDWGDGTVQTGLPVPAGTTSFTRTHTYADDSPSPGYSVKVTVRDDDTKSGASQAGIVVANVAPSVAPVQVGPAVWGAPVRLRPAWTDPGLVDTHRVTVDWGDGTVEQVDPATSPADLSHAYGSVGTFHAQVTVTDDDGGVGTRTVDIEVAPAPTELVASPALLKLSGLLRLTVSPGVFEVRLTHRVTGAPLPGRTVTMRATRSGTAICTAITGADGVARCISFAGLLAAIAGGGYEAAYPGASDTLPSADHGPLIGS
jgi:hypothetical protein